MTRSRRFSTSLAIALALALAPAAARSDDDRDEGNEPRVHATWMSIANWLFDLNGVRIVMDGYFTRVPPPPFFFGGGGGLAFTQGPFPVDVPLVLKVRYAIGGEDSRIDYVYTGHSHFDHSWDSPCGRRSRAPRSSATTPPAFRRWRRTCPRASAPRCSAASVSISAAA